MDSRDLESRLMQVAGQALESDLDHLAALPQGVRPVDSWQHKRYGGVLFWIDTSWDLHSWGTAVLQDALFRHDGQDRRPMGAGRSDTGTAEAIAVQKGPGLHRLGETSLAPVRLVQAFASPEVYALELRNARGGVSRRPGRDGFCLMGITDGDPMPCPNSRAITAKTPRAV
jgi:hypothetical protein